MSQFLGWAIFLIIAIGLVLHFDVDLPWYLDWIGRLPGDVLIKKGGTVLYAPITTSLLVSFVLSLILPSKK